MRRNTFLPLQPAATRSFFSGFGLSESSLAFCALCLEPSLQRGAVLALVGFPRQLAVWQPGFDVSASVRRRWVCLPFRLGRCVWRWPGRRVALLHSRIAPSGWRARVRRSTGTPAFHHHVRTGTGPGRCWSRMPRGCLRSMPTGLGALVVHQFWIDGYKDFNFMRASAVVKRQSTFMAS